MVERPNPSSRERDRQGAESETAAEAPSAGPQSGNPDTSHERHHSSPESHVGAGEARAEAKHVERAAKNHISLKSLTSLERLRDRVETAAHELKRLREENEALSERIRELESRPHVDPQGTFLSLDHDPELLRRKISGFIETIDRYLEKERKSS